MFRLDQETSPHIIRMNKSLFFHQTNTMLVSPKNVIIGNVYDVPTIETSDKQEIPVLLPAHSDSHENCLDDAPLHYHIDLRFCDPIENINAWYAKDAQKIYYKQFVAIRQRFCSIEKTGGFFFVNRWYNRKRPNKLVNGNCPHKGLAIVNNCGTCPGHGLIWEPDGTLKKIQLPFYLELANNGIHETNNPQGLLRDTECLIHLRDNFVSDGIIIMVDALGNRYGQLTQKIKPGLYKAGNCLTISAAHLCS